MDLPFDIRSPQAITVIALSVVALLVVVAVSTFLRQRRPLQDQQGEPDLSLDVRQLPQTGPPANVPTTLQIYGTSVRLAAVIVAPAGRQATVPAVTMVPAILDIAVPGLSELIPHHHPVLRLWPSQLSTQGFTHKFFNQVPLPGDKGRGTVWCSVAGKVQAGEQAMLIGLVACSAAANNLTQIVIQHEGQWLDVVRVRH